MGDAHFLRDFVFSTLVVVEYHLDAIKPFGEFFESDAHRLGDLYPKSKTPRGFPRRLLGRGVKPQLLLFLRFFGLTSSPEGEEAEQEAKSDRPTSA